MNWIQLLNDSVERTWVQQSQSASYKLCHNNTCPCENADAPDDSSFRLITLPKFESDTKYRTEWTNLGCATEIS